MKKVVLIKIQPYNIHIKHNAAQNVGNIEYCIYPNVIIIELHSQYNVRNTFNRLQYDLIVCNICLMFYAEH